MKLDLLFKAILFTTSVVVFATPAIAQETLDTDINLLASLPQKTFQQTKEISQLKDKPSLKSSDLLGQSPTQSTEIVTVM